MEPRMSAKHEGKNSMGVAAQFSNYQFETDVEELINFIQGLPNFGHEYWILEKGSKPAPVDRTPTPGVSEHFDPKEEGERRVADLENKVDKLSDVVLQLVDAVNANGVPATPNVGSSEDTEGEGEPEASEEPETEAEEEVVPETPKTPAQIKKEKAVAKKVAGKKK